MKKFLSFILAIIIFTGFITGCTQTTATCEKIGNDINKKLDKLSMSITKLDTIDNDYLASPDIYPTTKAVANLYLPNPNAIEENKTVKHSIATNIENDLGNILKSEIIKNLKCDNDGNCYICGNLYGDCDNNSCNSCGNLIICDNDGNCQNCNTLLNIDQYGNCQNCNKSCTKNSCSNIKYNNFNNYNNTNCADKFINPLENQTIEAETISIVDEPSDNNLNEEELSNTNNTENKTDTLTEDGSINNEESIDNENSPKVYYYYEEKSFTPENLKYMPRFISDTQIKDAGTNLNSYVIKIQKLYTMTADVVEANNILAQYKNEVLNSISNTKAINNSYKNSNLTPTIYQIQAINNYLHDLNTTTKNIKRANGDLNNEVNNINQTNNLGITSSVDVMNSNYLRILNHLDTRITYHENALSTLEQLRNYLLETINNQHNNVDNNITNNDNINDEVNSNINNNDNNNSNTPEDEIIMEESNQNNENNINSDNTLKDNLNQNLDNEQIIEEDDSINTNTSYQDQDNSIITEDNTTEDDAPVIVPNIDTYNDNIIEDNNDIVEDNNDIVEDNNDIVDTNNTDVNQNINTENLNSNITDQQNITIQDNLNNNNNNNNNNYNHNHIINENNLNTDGNITNNGYYYDENGNLYNSFNNNNLNTKKNNINTYEYNTLLDSLNQGTVNNGINNL